MNLRDVGVSLQDGTGGMAGSFEIRSSFRLRGLWGVKDVKEFVFEEQDSQRA